jgi:hypothetical protein
MAISKLSGSDRWWTYRNRATQRKLFVLLNSLVLFATANAKYEFIYCDIGTNGRISDGGVIENTKLYEN